MRRSGVRRSWAGLLLAGLLVGTFVSGCGEQQRHAVLEVLFDGVPPYVAPEDRGRVAMEAKAKAEAEAEAEARRRSYGRDRPKPKIARFTHGPFAAKECERCHALDRTSGFRASGVSTEALSGAGADLAEAGRLRVRVDQLCVGCHVDFARDAPGNAGLWMHGPVGAGWCVSCHEPHSSRYPHLVRADPSAQLCTRCHMRADLVAFTPEHRASDPGDTFPSLENSGVEAEQRASDGDEARSAADATDDDVVRVVASCTSCHDPHRGPNRFILRASVRRADRPPLDRVVD